MTALIICPFKPGFHCRATPVLQEESLCLGCPAGYPTNHGLEVFDGGSNFQLEVLDAPSIGSFYWKFQWTSNNPREVPL